MMERRRSEKRWADFAQANPTLIDSVRQEIRTRGPLANRDLEGKSVRHYRSGKETGIALYYLWLTGELMSHSRRGNERVYDLFENIVPAQYKGTATENEAIEFFTHKAISQYGFVNERDFRNILKTTTGNSVEAKKVKLKISEMVETLQLASVRVETDKEPEYFLASDTAIIDYLCEGKIPPGWQPKKITTNDEVVFLSPLEYISARGRAKNLFEFDYIWEIYKPAEKRKYGPYTMPILFGDQLVGRVDAKLERENRILVINGFWLEGLFDPTEGFVVALAKGLYNLARFLGAAQINSSVLSPASLKIKMNEYLRSTGVNIFTT